MFVYLRCPYPYPYPKHPSIGIIKMIHSHLRDPFHPQIHLKLISCTENIQEKSYS